MAGVTPVPFESLDDIAPALRPMAVKAPDEYGGQYWLLTPWSGKEPWKRFYEKPPEVKLPEGFVGIFGEKPDRTQDNYRNVSAAVLRDAVAEWELQLKNFKQIGLPPWFEDIPQSVRDASLLLFVEYGLSGVPRIFENTYGWRIVWPNSALPTRSQPAYEALTNPHQVIANQQVRMLLLGIVPAKISDLVPPHLYTPQ